MSTQSDPWIDAPIEAFDQFIQSTHYAKTSFRIQSRENLSDNSIKLYKSYFNSFIEFIAQRNRNIRNVDPDTIYAFLVRTTDHEDVNQRQPILKSAIQHRYIRLLERVFQFLQRNPAPTDDLLFGPMRENYKLRGRNRPSVSMTQQQIQSLFSQTCPSRQPSSAPAAHPLRGKRQRSRPPLRFDWRWSQSVGSHCPENDRN